jgi:hypothetical protein
MNYYTLFWADQEMMKAAGLDPDIPTICDEDWKFHVPASDYLVDRANGDAFNPGDNVKVFPKRSSLETYGHLLIDFLEWCSFRKTDWKNIEYKKDLCERYVVDMEKGKWSTLPGDTLKPRTINQRVDEATRFCQWAARKQLRPLFDVPTYKKRRKRGGITSRSHEIIEIESRAGKKRPDPIELKIPSDDQVETWLDSVKQEKGETLALMCELIIKTAIRREECAQWRNWTLPEEKHDWKITGHWVTVKLEYGTKGRNRTNERGDTVGPARYIDLPIELAYRIHDYREFKRDAIRMKYIKNGRTTMEQKARHKEREPRLFIGEYNGTPVNGKTIERGWTSASKRPYSGWSPHIARHYWTCKKLLNRFKEREAALAEGTLITAEWITGAAMMDIRIEIMPQLGHVDPSTTDAYLVWLKRMTLSAKHSDAYIAALEDLFLEDIYG